MSLAFRNVGHSYGDHRVLSGVTLEARPGEILCLLGPSGSGKTTLLRLAAGLETLQEGSIDLGGAVLATPGRDVPPEKRSFGMVFQDHALFPHLTVAENIGFGLAKRPKEEIRAIVAERLASVGLAGFETRYPHTLSGGQKQRIAIAREGRGLSQRSQRLVGLFQGLSRAAGARARAPRAEGGVVPRAHALLLHLFPPHPRR